MEEIEAPLNPVPPPRTPNHEAAATPRSDVQNGNGNVNGNGGPAYPMAGEPNGETAPADPEVVQEAVPAKKPAMALGGGKGKWGNLKKIVVNAPDSDQGANASENAPDAHLSQEDVEIKRAILGLKEVKKTQSQSLLKQMMGVKEENERIDIKATLDNIERWPVKRKGYAQLASFLLFFTLYCFTMVMQINPGSVFRIDDALRNQVVDEGGALQDVATLGDLFDYLEGQIMENVFPAAWYNDDPLTTSESGYVLDYNKLVGGLLIVQRRGLRRKCVEPRYKSMNSSYDDFYRTCYTEQTTESLWPANETAAKLEAPASLDYKVPWIPGTPLEYDAKNPETIFGKSPTAAPPQQVSDILANNNKLGNFADAFVYDHRYQGFAAFLAYADGATKNLAKLDALKQALWLDKYTRGIDIKFAVYNGYVNMFTFVAISFNYALTGSFKEYQRDGGTQVVIKTVNMEPYRIGGDNPSDDLVRLICEIVLLVWIFNYVSSLIREICEIYFKEGWAGKKKKDRKTGEIVTIGGLKNFLSNPWTVIDSLNYALYIWYIAVRVDILSTIYNKDKIIVVPTNRYESVLEEISGKLSMQLFLNFANILLCLIRCFKFYRFQPRLAIINETLKIAFPDLYHFCLMFITVLFGFSVMSTILFGAEMWYFSSLFESLNTGFMWMVGGGLDFTEIARVDAEMAVVFYVSFIFLINIVLLNVLLAILVDSYAAATEKLKEEYDDDVDSIPSLFSDLWEILIRSVTWTAVSDNILLTVLTGMEENGSELETLEEVLAHIPKSIVEDHKLTVAKIQSNPSVVIKEIDLEEEKLNKADDFLKEALANYEEAEAPQSRQDKMEAALLTQLDELVRENTFLKRKFTAVQHQKEQASKKND